MLEEALVLRKAEISAPILVLGWVQPEYAKIAAEQDITLTFFQKEWLEQVNFKSLMKPLKLHMKWDTGMGRIGIRTEEELNEVIFKLRQMEKIHLTGIYTHFSTADEQGTDFFLKQNERFNQLLQAFQKNGLIQYLFIQETVLLLFVFRKRCIIISALEYHYMVSIRLNG